MCLGWSMLPLWVTFRHIFKCVEQNLKSIIFLRLGGFGIDVGNIVEEKEFFGFHFTFIILTRSMVIIPRSFWVLEKLCFVILGDPFEASSKLFNFHCILAQFATRLRSIPLDNDIPFSL